MGGGKSVKFITDFMTIEATIRGIIAMIARLEYDYPGVYVVAKQLREYNGGLEGTPI